MNSINGNDLFETRDIQTHLSQFLSLSDIINNFQLVSKQSSKIINNRETWSVLLQQDFKLFAGKINFNDARGAFLFYKTLYLEQNFIKSYSKESSEYLNATAEELKVILDKDSPWIHYFKVSSYLHGAYFDRYSGNIRNNEPEIKQALLSLIETSEKPLFERLCWLVANHYWFFNRHFDSELFKFIKQLESTARQTKNLVYMARSDHLYALHLIQQKEQSLEEDSDDEYDSDEENAFPAKHTFQSIVTTLKEKDHIFYPILARLMLRDTIDGWRTYFPQLTYHRVVKILHETFNDFSEGELSLDAYIISLYSLLAKSSNIFRDIIYDSEPGVSNIFYSVDWDKQYNQLISLIKNEPELFLYETLLQVQANLDTPSDEQKARLKNILDITMEKKYSNSNVLVDSDEDDDYHPHHGYDSDSDNYYGRSEYSSSYHNFFKPPTAEQYALATEQMKLMQNISSSNEPKKFNKSVILSFINNALGQNFIDKYINTKKGTWVVNEVKTDAFIARFDGLLMTSQADCQWFKAKLIKADIKEKNINFKPVKINNQNRFQMEIINLQDIKLNKNQLGNDKYTQFLIEMDEQIDNINAAKDLLSLEQKALTLRGDGGCIRAIQNMSKLRNLNELIKLFETARTEANQNNYDEKRKEVYDEAEDYGYTKTNSKEDALSAYYSRTWA